MGVFYEPPKDDAQRDRWLFILNLLATEVILSRGEIIRRMKEETGFEPTYPLLKRDLESLRVEKRDGVFVQVMPDRENEYRLVLKRRLQVACHAMILRGDDVIALVNRGAGAWIGEVWKELSMPLVETVINDNDSVVLLCKVGEAEKVYEEYHDLWRR